MVALWRWILLIIRCALSYLPATNRSFVILSSARSGSSLLVQLLNYHERIKCHGELLNRERLHDRGLVDAREKDLIDYVSRIIFPANSWLPYRMHTGFKLFNEQMEYCKVSFGEILSKLQCSSVIVLYRRNMLETFVSLKIAFQNNIWYSESIVNDERVEVNWEEFHKYVVTERMRWEQSLSQISHSHQLLLVSYEELALKKASTIRDIFSFLGLAPCYCGTSSKRQNPLPLCDKVRNYEEIMTKVTEHRLPIYLTEKWLKTFVT